MQLARRFSVTNFFIATSALGFQVFVLYPWHKKLDDEFQVLRQEQRAALLRVEESRVREMEEIKKLVAGELEARRSWWRWGGR